MKPWLARGFLLMALPCLPLALVACDGDSDNDDDPPADTNAVAEASMTGTWNGDYSTGVSFTFALTQEGDAVSGDYATEGGVEGTVSGTVSGNAVDLTVVTTGGVTAEFDGSVNDERTSMGGDFEIVAGGGGSGTWSATK